MEPSTGRTIALLTDFGTEDPFVGVMKAVILSRCPGAAVVDLTHAIPPQAVLEGAFWLARSFGWFSRGTVFVAVVDPGVGTERRSLLVEAHDRIFVGPDNGLLAETVSSDPGRRIHEIDIGKVGLPAPSRTFHGRDVFAPVAAEVLAGRIDPRDVGRRIEEMSPSPLPVLVVNPDSVEGKVVTVDRFGNLITNITSDSIAAVPDARVHIGGRELPLRQTYADARPGECVGLVNAFGTVEVAERDGNASSSLELGRGARVVVRRGAG